MPRPIPLVEPVTRETLPLSEGETAAFGSVMAMFMASCLLGWRTPVLGWTPRFFSQDDASDRTQT